MNGVAGRIESTFVDYHNEVMAVVRADTRAKLVKVGKMVRDTARDEVPVRTGALKKSIRTRVDLDGMSVRIIAGSFKAWYVHLVLYGTVIRERISRRRRRKGAHGRGVGKVEPNDFLGRALEKNIDAIKEEFSKPIRTVSEGVHRNPLTGNLTSKDFVLWR